MVDVMSDGGLCYTSYWVTCPQCNGAGELYIPAVTVGEPQPEEWQPCVLCGGMGDVTARVAKVYHRDGLEAALALGITI